MVFRRFRDCVTRALAGVSLEGFLMSGNIFGFRVCLILVRRVLPQFDKVLGGLL